MEVVVTRAAANGDVDLDDFPPEGRRPPGRASPPA
jgi:hypothetical protein